jgi:hypothetical protein
MPGLRDEKANGKTKNKIMKAFIAVEMHFNFNRVENKYFKITQKREQSIINKLIILF